MDRWQRLPEIAAEIDRWDLVDQLVFIEEWPLEEQRLRMLEQYAADGVLTPAQLARFELLRCIVAEHRPIILRLRQT